MWVGWLLNDFIVCWAFFFFGCLFFLLWRSISLSAQHGSHRRTPNGMRWRGGGARGRVEPGYPMGGATSVGIRNAVITFGSCQCALHRSPLRYYSCRSPPRPWCNSHQESSPARPAAVKWSLKGHPTRIISSHPRHPPHRTTTTRSRWAPARLGLTPPWTTSRPRRSSKRPWMRSCRVSRSTAKDTEEVRSSLIYE